MNENRTSKIEDRLASGEPLLLDGGLGTELERRGHDVAHPLWSARLLLENPDAVTAVHEDFLRAGSDIITTATYQASFPALQREGLSRADAAAVFLQAVDLAAAARDRVKPDALVAASIGPYGAFLADGSEYIGNYGKSKTALTEFHTERLEILSNSPVDLIAFETIPSLTETEILTELLQTFPDTRAWISFQCRDDSALADGSPLAEAARLAAPLPQIIAVGVNCVPPANVPHLLRLLHAGAPSKALAAYPNAAQSYDPSTRSWSGQTTPESFARAALSWLKKGTPSSPQAGAPPPQPASEPNIMLLGGCCYTTPEHIRALASTLPKFA